MIRQLALPFAHTPQYDGAAFLQAPSNAEALAWLARPDDWPMRRLALWGEAGCGKSHLLDRWAKRHGTRVLDGATLALEPPTGPVAVDDADLAGERPLLHLLNAAAEARFPLVLVGRAAPARWAVGLADLASRLRATLAVEIRTPDDTLLHALLAALFADRQLAVAPPVQDYLLMHLPRTPAALREAAARLDRLALAAGGRVTRALAASVIADLAPPPETTRFDEDLPMAAAGASQEGPGFL